MGGHRISPPSCPERPVARGALSSRRAWEAGLKSPEEVMEILEAFDLCGTLRGAAQLAGCDHKTVAQWVEAREAVGGGLPVSVRPRPTVDPFAEKIEEWVERSRGKIRADRAHEKLVAMGYRSARRAERWRPRSGRGARSTAAARARGCASRGCGCSGTTATGPRWRAARRCSSARGWRGAAFGSCCRSGTGRWRRW